MLLWYICQSNIHGLCLKVLACRKYNKVYLRSPKLICASLLFQASICEPSQCVKYHQLFWRIFCENYYIYFTNNVSIGLMFISSVLLKKIEYAIIRTFFRRFILERDFFPNLYVTLSNNTHNKSEKKGRCFGLFLFSKKWFFRIFFKGNSDFFL